MSPPEVSDVSVDLLRDILLTPASATSKKFVAALEPILLAPPGKALVSAQTHRMITDIAADVTYNFGGEKGSESLVELWRKVKLPQGSEHVSRAIPSKLTTGRASSCRISTAQP